MGLDDVTRSSTAVWTCSRRGMLRRSAVSCALAVLLLGAAVLAADSAAGTANVLTITADSFDQAVADHSFLVVEFYAPWCGHCKSLAPEWEKAATELKGDTSAGQAITLAMVDATVERSLAEKFHIGGFPTIKIFEGNSAANPAEYEGPRQADGIVAYLKVSFAALPPCCDAGGGCALRGPARRRQPSRSTTLRALCVVAESYQWTRRKGVVWVCVWWVSGRQMVGIVSLACC